MKIGILGGSFDPPHLGHLFIAVQVREIVGVDQIWFMPLYQHTMHSAVFHKKISDVIHRFAMVRLMETNFIKASDFEISQNKNSYTIDTLDLLASRHLNDTFYWIMGSDQLEDFRKYHRWDEILQRHKLIIFPRESVISHLPDLAKQSLQLQSLPENVTVLDNKELIMSNISSTKIRERVSKELSIDYFVSMEVKEYIQRKELYK